MRIPWMATLSTLSSPGFFVTQDRCVGGTDYSNPLPRKRIGIAVDVSIRLSLRGGHHWEFVCDEDDPMVFGLVSALPGVTIDPALPPDGLIQVEARNGQRLYLGERSAYRHPRRRCTWSTA
jgi:hypothetical protein